MDSDIREKQFTVEMGRLAQANASGLSSEAGVVFYRLLIVIQNRLHEIKTIPEEPGGHRFKLQIPDCPGGLMEIGFVVNSETHEILVTEIIHPSLR